MSIYRPEDRHLPVRPNLDQLKHQAKDLLRAIRRGDATALEEFRHNHPDGTQLTQDLVEAGKISAGPAKAKRLPIILADAQLALARSYGAPSWPRLVLACNLIDAIWRDDLEAVRKIVQQNPQLVHEDARIRKTNWGPPLSYAANLGRDEVIKLLYKFGALDLEHALGRAILQSKIETAAMLHQLLGSPLPPAGSLAGPAYTLSAPGTAFALRVGAPVLDQNGNRLAPVDVVLETDSRNPTAKHEILEMYVRHGLQLPDTPTMAMHRGRIDLLENQLRHDPNLLRRTFSHEEIYPPAMGCHDQVQATQGTPLAGTTLLHLCVDYDEIEIARWLITKGADVNCRAEVDRDGFGGHTPLFCSVVSQPNFWMSYQNREQVAPFAKLLLQNGADPNVRASLRKQLHPGYAPKYDIALHEYRNITPLSWGRQFHAKVFVSEPAMKLIEEYGGRE